MCKKCSCMYKFIASMRIEDVQASVQNILACKYISPTSIKIVSVVVHIIPVGITCPTGYKYENVCAVGVIKLGDKSPQVFMYIFNIHKNTTI